MNDFVKKTAAKNGLILGTLLTFLNAYIYFYNNSLISNIGIGFFFLLLFIACGIFSVLKVKSLSNGKINFRTTFSAYFITILTAHALIALGLIIITNLLISPEIAKAIKKMIIDFNINTLKLNNASQKDIANAIQLSKNYNPFAITEILSGSLKYLLRDSIIGLVVAAFFRNTK